MSFTNRLINAVLLLCLILPITSAWAITFGSGQIAPAQLGLNTAANDNATGTLGLGGTNATFNRSTPIKNIGDLFSINRLNGASVVNVGGIQFQAQDFITFAHQNNIPLAIDSLYLVLIH